MVCLHDINVIKKKIMEIKMQRRNIMSSLKPIKNDASWLKKVLFIKPILKPHEQFIILKQVREQRNKYKKREIHHQKFKKMQKSFQKIVGKRRLNQSVFKSLMKRDSEE